MNLYENQMSTLFSNEMKAEVYNFQLKLSPCKKINHWKGKTTHI